ncbi:MAG: [protein-PII] uridylyltransferase [Rugosibacter sp.]|jgi:[protein-PII] uridylyltransferase|nr:[protein-PII] uridylyltransferase [Rugosibacter sp.]
MTDLRALALTTREQLTVTQERLVNIWRQNQHSRELLANRAGAVDDILRGLWITLDLPPTATLVAVGGYGRGVLYPASDIDLLILQPAAKTTDNPAQALAQAANEEKITTLVGMLWDIGLDIGHSVRTVAECLSESARDITIQTSLLEARYLIGDAQLYADFGQRFSQALDPAAFLKAKQLEQAERYAKYQDTPYSLEPNCKENPGGLRDLQVIQWVARAAKLGDSWPALVSAGLITAVEARQFERCEWRLRELRIRLHLLAGRREDRLLFDYQEKLADNLGIAATSAKRASEILMQHYYKTAKLVTQLNTLTLQALDDYLLPKQVKATIIINQHFQTVRDRLDIRADDTFERAPQALLECFAIQMQRGEIKGMTPRTLRALWRARRLINAPFRADPANRALFIQLFQQPHLIHALRRMNQYDILGRYLPAFGRIVGQMQHDLFHVYTVDQHILQVMRNLRRFAMPELAHEYPLCSRLMMGFERHWLLYIAALFHDIAKGRGGDHSALGVVDASTFCRDHNLNQDDTGLVAFLVAEHLTMSQVAQKQDLSDPQVIAAFAQRVGNLRRLTALYLFTVADIRGTSPKVWNAWKGKLLEDLYRMTAQLLSGDAVPQLAGVAEKQEEARRILRYYGLRQGVEAPLWTQLDVSYFMRHLAEEIAWHARNLYYCSHAQEPVVRAHLNPGGEGLQVMVYCPDQPQLFARLCGFFALMGYSIMDARIHTTHHRYALDSFIISTPNDGIAYRDMISLIEHDLSQQLTQRPALPAIPAGRLSRMVRHFPMAPTCEIIPDERGEQYLMNISAIDRPGMLYAIARVLDDHHVRLHTAKIATLGERVEDVFLLSGQALTQTATLVKLEQDLLAALQV